MTKYDQGYKDGYNKGIEGCVHKLRTSWFIQLMLSDAIIKDICKDLRSMRIKREG